jgi:aminoglycoside/choline kinase family phosphotransferase
MNSIYSKIKELYKKTYGKEAESVELMQESGSYRKYFRIKNANTSIIAVFNQDLKENDAFISFTKSFASLGLKVPEIYANFKDEGIYFQQDLGSMTLFDHIAKKQDPKQMPEEIIRWYKQVLHDVLDFQIKASPILDYSKCYPRAVFDRQSMMWDLNYFKYYFLKFSRVQFDEQALEYDFQRFVKYLLEAPVDFFMYRDLQSRNIMIHKDQVYFIDYQGGRKGFPAYDVASLLYDAKANLSNELREELLQYYVNLLEKQYHFPAAEFMKYYYGFVYIRIMQAFGAYGFRGFYERKEHFLKSIPYAIKNMEYLLQHASLPYDFPEMRKTWEQLIDIYQSNAAGEQDKKLNVRIFSFSYRRGIPLDKSGNGGGFVFDCRVLENPGKQEKFKKLNGKDKAVADFLSQQADVEDFTSHTKALCFTNIDVYLKRNFSNLMLCFGCTGGQHRSVYMAEKIHQLIKEKYNNTINIQLMHKEINHGE